MNDFTKVGSRDSSRISLQEEKRNTGSVPILFVSINYDDLVKSRICDIHVIPAKAGIQ